MKKMFILLLLTTFAFSQEEVSFFENAEIDSVEYYKQKYQHHLEEYQKDKKASATALTTSLVSLGIGGALGCIVIVDEFSRFDNSDKSGTKMSSPLVITSFSFLGISIISATVYAFYEINAHIEKNDSDMYNRKKTEYQSKYSAKISVIPLLDPIDNRFGTLFALNF